MKLLALLLLICACEHDPRYERHQDHRPAPAAASTPIDAPSGSDKTVERHGVDVPPMAPSPAIVPIDKRTHRHRRH